MLLFTLLQGTDPSIVGRLLEGLNNPVLALLLLVLGAVIYYLFKQLGSKDIYIKELNNTLLEHTVKNLEVIKNLEHSISLDDAAHRALETLLRENNSFLQTIIRSLKT